MHGTVEFFPEEGKYHSGRAPATAGAAWSPPRRPQLGGRCPVCGKQLTIGVLHRVEQLADRAGGLRSPDAKPFESLIPLPEVLAASTGRGPPRANGCSAHM